MWARCNWQTLEIVGLLDVTALSLVDWTDISEESRWWKMHISMEHRYTFTRTQYLLSVYITNTPMQPWWNSESYPVSAANKYGRQFFYSRLFIIRCTEFSYRLCFILLLLDPSYLSVAVSNEFDWTSKSSNSTKCFTQIRLLRGYYFVPQTF